jgi:hypothetical protein
VQRLRAFVLDLASGRLDDLFLNGDVDHVYPQAASFCKCACTRFALTLTLPTT